MSFNYDSSLSFSGEIDATTGLYYFNARWYDAETGRFISEDPARDQSNWYIYVSNNPLKFIDPTGMREVVDEDERGNLTVENPDGTLKDRNHGDDRTREYTDRSGTEKPDDPTKPGNLNTNGLLPEGALTPKEIPEEVAKALQEAGVPLTGEEPTIDDLNKALEDMTKSGFSPDEVKDLANDLKDQFKEILDNLSDLDPATKEKIEGALMMAAGVGIAGGSIIIATVAPIPAAATGLTTGAGVAAYGFSRYMNAGRNKNSVSEDIKNAFTPPMSELSKIEFSGIR